MPTRSPYSRSVTAAMFLLNTASAGGARWLERWSESRVAKFSGHTSHGTMKVTQEIDALTTMGISPFQFLLLPRVIALVLMMPLLCLYSDLMGILGGAFVGVGMLGLSFTNYMRETIHALSLTNLLLGLIKGTVYGALIAMAGCLRGFVYKGNSQAGSKRPGVWRLPVCRRSPIRRVYRGFVKAG